MIGGLSGLTLQPGQSDSVTVVFEPAANRKRLGNNFNFSGRHYDLNRTIRRRYNSIVPGALGEPLLGCEHVFWRRRLLY